MTSDRITLALPGDEYDYDKVPVDLKILHEPTELLIDSLRAEFSRVMNLSDGDMEQITGGFSVGRFQNRKGYFDVRSVDDERYSFEPIAVQFTMVLSGPKAKEIEDLMLASEAERRERVQEAAREEKRAKIAALEAEAEKLRSELG